MFFGRYHALNYTLRISISYILENHSVGPILWRGGKHPWYIKSYIINATKMCLSRLIRVYYIFYLHDLVTSCSCGKIIMLNSAVSN